MDKLKKNNETINKDNTKLVLENTKLKESNKTLKSRKNRAVFSIIGLAVLLGVSLYAIIEDDDD